MSTKCIYKRMSTGLLVHDYSSTTSIAELYT